MEGGAHAVRPQPDDRCRTLPRRRSRSMPNCSLWFDIAALPSSSGCFPLRNFAACGRPRLRGWRPLQAQGRGMAVTFSWARAYSRPATPSSRAVAGTANRWAPLAAGLPPRSLIRVLGPRPARAMERASVTCIRGKVAPAGVWRPRLLPPVRRRPRSGSGLRDRSARGIASAVLGGLALLSYVAPRASQGDPSPSVRCRVPLPARRRPRRRPLPTVPIDAGSWRCATTTARSGPRAARSADERMEARMTRAAVVVAVVTAASSAHAQTFSRVEFHSGMRLDHHHPRVRAGPSRRRLGHVQVQE